MRRFVVLLFFVAVVAAATARPAAAASVVLRPPVDASVLDPYRPPAGGFGSGNRGIEYATAAGDRVVAAGPGVVVFAGPVAGRSWITIDHGDGLRTSYGPVDTIRVDVGDTVRRGEQLARTTGPLHFSTRIDGDYVDPAGLLGVREVRVRLIDHTNDDDQRWLDLVEREERRRLLLDHGGGIDWWGALDRVFGLAAELGAPLLLIDPEATLSQHIAELVHFGEVVGTLAEGLDHRALINRMIEGMVQVVDPPLCTPVGVAAAAVAPTGRRIAIVLDGLDSSSAEPGAMAALDLGVLGYAAADVGRVSYGGGLVPGSGAAAWPVARSAYDAATTRGDIEPRIADVAATLRAVAAANPGVPIDVYGHSLGGLIARHAIAEVAADVPIGVAVTLASPHAGAPIADLLEVLELTAPGAVVSDVAATAWPEMALVAPIIEDLSATGFAGDTKSVAFPESVHAVTIGARADVVVPAGLAAAPGAEHVIVGGLDPFGAHGEIAGLPEVEREVRLALAGFPPACQGTGDAILDLVVPEAIAYGETAFAVGLLIADLAPS